MKKEPKIMPYIIKEQRKRYDVVLDQMRPIMTKGDLEYCIFRLMKKYMSDKEEKYLTIHDCVYAAIHAGHEFERRYLDKREDAAMETNGDIE
jgi:hypothetical protein